MTTLPAARHATAAAARALRCDVCWAQPGTPCQRNPETDHLGRYIEARTGRDITEAAVGAVLAELDIITATVLVEATP